jgi:hypothetical protein
VASRVIAYKFLADGAVGPFTRFRWPVGDWVESESIEPCRAGVHACRARDLPFWLGRELWEIELDGEIVERERKVIARRGRLVRRREEWTRGLLDEFVADLQARARRRFGSVPVVSGYLEDIERFRSAGRFGLAAFAAARAAERYGGPREYERERVKQADWLTARLG